MLKLITVATYLIFGIIVLIGTLRGIKKGWKFSLYKTIAIIVLGIVSFVVAKIVSKLIVKSPMNFIAGMDNDFIQTIEKLQDIMAIVEAIVAVLITIILFAVLFGVFEIIQLSVGKPIRKKFFANDKKSFLGVIIGAVDGILVATVIVLPLVFALNVVSSCDPTVLKKANIDIGTKEINTYLPSELLVKPISKLNCDKLSDKYRNKIKNAYASEELPDLINVIVNLPIINDPDVDMGTEFKTEFIKALPEVSKYKGDSQLVPILVSELAGMSVDTGSSAYSSEDIGNFLNLLLDTNPTAVETIMNVVTGKSSNISEDDAPYVVDALIDMHENEEYDDNNKIFVTISSDFIEKSDIDISQNIENEKVQDEINELVGELNDAYDKNASYKEQIDSLSDIISDKANNEYNFELSEAKTKLISVGIVSLMETGEELTYDDISALFGIK